MKEGYQDMLDHCFELSQEMLVMDGEFHPFGAFLGEAGRVQHLGVELEPKNMPSNGEIVNRLIKLAKEEGLENFALCFEVSIQLEADSPASDAICVEITDPETPKFYQTYSKSADEINFGEIFAVR